MLRFRNRYWTLAQKQFQRDQRNLYITLHVLCSIKITSPYAQAFIKWCIFLISGLKSCGKLKLPMASGRSNATTPPFSLKSYTSSKDRPNLQAQQTTTGKQNATVISPVSQIWALIVFPSTCILLVANSTPIVDLDSKLNSFLVNRDSKFDFPTPESPMRTTVRNEPQH